MSTSTVKRVAFFVNPVAGVGGELAWKGTFDVEKAWSQIHDKAFDEIRSIHRAKKALQSIPSSIRQSFLFLVPEGLMGSSVLQDIPGLQYERIYSPVYPTNADSTLHFLSLLCTLSVDLLVFVGGDGTAFLVKQGIDECRNSIPVIGIPGGVKITSECYLNTPSSLGDLLQAWLNGETQLTEAIVSDLDERAYREQRVEKHVAGPVLTLSLPKILQGEKLVSQELTHDPELLEMELEDIADSLRDKNILKHKLIVGAGTTTYNVFKCFNIQKTLLGVDIIENGSITHQDIDCKTLTQWFSSLPENEQKTLRVIVTPIGGQGYIFGRGNQQICCSILDELTPEQIIIIATSEKIQGLTQLKIDTDCDRFQQKILGKYLRVLTSGNREIVKKVFV